MWFYWFWLGVTIESLTGSDFAPAKANEAKQKNDIGEAKVDVYLTAQNAQTEAYESVYVEGKKVGTDAAVTAENAATEIGTYVRNKLCEKYPESGATKIGLATIKATAGGEVTISTKDFEVIGEIEVKGGILTWGEIEEAALDLNKQQRDTILSTTSKTKLKDNKGNKIVIPANFKLSSENAVKTAGNNVEEGIIIEDEDGNQFVWVPVGTITKSNGDSVNIPLGRYKTFTPNSDGEYVPVQEASNGYVTTTASHGIGYYYEFKNDAESIAVINNNYGNTKAKNIQAFVESANRNGGYYIARYEAGIDGTTDQYALAGFDWKSDDSGIEPTDSTKVVATDGSVKPIIKRGYGVWNAVTQPQAATICRNMYSTEVNSDLMNSYAWDTAIIFIQQCSSNSGYASSSSLQNTLTTTGNANNGTNYDNPCNIYDMAGNAYEWTTESFKDQNYPCVFRGTNTYLTYCTGARGIWDLVLPWHEIGFRPILYL